MISMFSSACSIDQTEVQGKQTAVLEELNAVSSAPEAPKSARLLVNGSHRNHRAFQAWIRYSRSSAPTFKSARMSQPKLTVMPQFCGRLLFPLIRFGRGESSPAFPVPTFPRIAILEAISLHSTLPSLLHRLATSPPCLLKVHQCPLLSKTIVGIVSPDKSFVSR